MNARNPLLNRRAWQLVGESLNLDALQAVAARCLGEHDFAAFGTPPQLGSSNTVRHIFRSSWEMETADYGAVYTYEIRGTAFLYHMVRRLVGTMVQVGRGRLSPLAFQDILRSRDIGRAKVLAPPQGLVLEALDIHRGVQRRLQLVKLLPGRPRRRWRKQYETACPEDLCHHAGAIERRWWLIDAKGLTLGRVASRVAPLLRGTHKPYFTPHRIPATT